MCGLQGSFTVRFKDGRPQKKLLSELFLNARSTGLEPATSRVTGECSNQLSYDRKGSIRNLFTLTPSAADRLTK